MGEPERRGPGRLTVLSGPSGVGKSTIADYLRSQHPEIWLSVSVTTRAPRVGEVDGVQYRFVDAATFDAMLASGELLEHDFHFGHFYGTPREPVEQRLAAGQPSLLEIDVEGARQVRAAMPQARLVFLAPPSLAELERRLSGRSTEDRQTVRHRLERAREEMAAEAAFDHVVVNHEPVRTAELLVALMTT